MNDARTASADPEVNLRPEEVEESDLRDLLLRYWRYKYLICAIMVVVVAGAFLYAEHVTPLYRATSVLLVEPPETNVIDLDAVVEGLDRTPETMMAEIEVLQSRSLMEKTAEQLDLFENPRFSAANKKRSVLSHLNPMSYIPGEWVDPLIEFWEDTKASLFGDEETVLSIPPTSEDIERRRRRYVVDRLLAGLELETGTRTRVIKISFIFENRQLAKSATNALADTYVRNTLEVKYAGTRQAVAMLGEQLEELRLKAEESEAAAEALRQGEVLIQARGADIVSQQISNLNQQVLEAQEETSHLRTRLRQIQQLRNAPDWEEQTSAALDSSFIEGLRLEKFKLEQEAEALSTEYGDKHPKMINIRAEISEVGARIGGEIDRIVGSIKNNLEIAIARQNLLQSELNKLTSQAGSLSETEVRLRALEREAEANRLLYESFLHRFKEASVQEEMQEADARVISYAEVPRSAFYPEKKKFLALGGALGLFLGFGLVFGLESLDKGFRTREQLEQMTGLPIVGTIPLIKTSSLKGGSLVDVIEKEPYSIYSEAISMLYLALKLPKGLDTEEIVAKTVLVTSALPGEGKTSTAMALARRAARMGDNVLFIDCDFRNPEATRTYGFDDKKGLTEVIAGKLLLTEALQETPQKSLKFLSAGSMISDPTALLRSKAFSETVSALTTVFDLVILDSSPILAVADPQILSGLVDDVLVMVKWGSTPRKSAHVAVKQLQRFKVPITGLVLNQVDLKKQSYYGYGEYGYYANRMKGYYLKS